MNFGMIRARLALLALCCLPILAGAGASACGDKKGGLMLSVSTDMKAPKDVSVVSLTILTNNQVKYNFIGRVLPNGEVRLPATIAIAEPDDKNASIRIRAIAFQERQARVLRDTRTTVPTGGRLALLRLPLNFIDDGSAIGTLTKEQIDSVPATGTLPPDPLADGGGFSDASSDAAIDGASGLGGKDTSGFGGGELDPYSQFDSICGAGDELTSIDGVCRDSFVDSGTLPDFDPALVGDGQNTSSCFDANKCLAGAQTLQGVTTTGDTCTIDAAGRDVTKLNLALQTASTGECLAAGRCYVPIDHGDHGWKESGTSIELAAGVCKKISSGAAVLVADTSGACAPKDEKQPVCNLGDATAGTGKDGGTSADGGTTPPPIPIPVAPESWCSSLAFSDDQLLFAGQTRMGKVDTKTMTGTDVDLGPGNVGTIKPWRIGAKTQFGTPVVDGTSTGFVLQIEANGRQGITLPGPGQSTVAAGDNGNAILWAVIGQDVLIQTGIVSGEIPPAGLSDSVGPLTLKDVSTIVPLASGQFMLAQAAGTVRSCSSSSRMCGPAAALGHGRIDDITTRVASVDPYKAWATTEEGLLEVDISLSSGIIANAKLHSELGVTAGIDKDGSHYPRGLAAIPDGCAFVATANGLEWIKDAQHGIVAPAPPQMPVIGVVLGPGNTLFFTLFGEAAMGGGVYTVDLPAACK